MEGLRGCPFCGKTPTLGKVRFGIEQDCRYTLHCDTCCYNIGWLETEEEAAKKWNHRAEPSKLEIKTAISNIDKPSGLDDEQFFAVMANIYYALAKLYGEEIPEYMPSGGKEDEN